jgi:hypothetical protein
MFLASMLAFGLVAGLLTAVAIDLRLAAIEVGLREHEDRLQRVEAVTRTVSDHRSLNFGNRFLGY